MRNTEVACQGKSILVRRSGQLLRKANKEAGVIMERLIRLKIMTFLDRLNNQINLKLTLAMEAMP